MNNFNKKLISFIYNFSFVFSWWYSLWVSITKPIRNNMRLPVYSEISEIVKALNFGKDYKLDPLNGTLDIIYHPRRIQNRINNGDKIGDCDDHAIYWATCLSISDLAKDIWIGVVHYKKEDGKVAGHAVCVFRDHNDNLYWADYRMPYSILTHEDWAIQIGSEKYGTEIIAAALIPVSKISKNETPKFKRSFRVI